MVSTRFKDKEITIISTDSKLFAVSYIAFVLN